MRQWQRNVFDPRCFGAASKQGCCWLAEDPLDDFKRVEVY
jgi:hypothetical protein